MNKPKDRCADGKSQSPTGIERLIELLGRIVYIGPALFVLGVLLAIALPASTGWGLGGGVCEIGAMLTVVVPWERRRLRGKVVPATGVGRSNHP